MALVTVEDILSYLGHDAEQDAFWVYYSGAAATATVQISLDHLILIHDAVTDANWDLSLAAYDTVGELVAAINVLAGWEAGIFCHSSSDSADLKETGMLDALGEENEQTLIITGDYLISQLLARAEDFLNRLCRRTLEETEYTHERYDGGVQKIFLRNWPVTEITQISSSKAGVIRVRYTSTTAYNAFVIVTTTGVILEVDGTPIAEKTFAALTTLQTMAASINGEAGCEATVASTNYNSYPSSQLFRKLNRFALNQYIYLEIPDEPIDGYEVEYDTGILRFDPTFSSGWRNIFVTYKAGYVAGSIPASLQQIVIALVKYKYNLIGKDPTLKSETIGRVYSYTMGDLEKALSSAGLLEEINLFKARVVQ